MKTVTNNTIAALRNIIQSNNQAIGSLEAIRHSHQFPGVQTGDSLFACLTAVAPMTAQQKAENVAIDAAIDALIACNQSIRIVISEIE